MKIAIISDSHDRWGNLEKAIDMANDRGCEYLLHAGDLVAPPGIKMLEKFNGKVKFVWGNNEGEKMGMTRLMDIVDNIDLCGDVYEGDISGVNVFMNHYPWAAKLAAKSGIYDLCVYGHTHEYYYEKLGDVMLLNPGEVAGFKNDPSMVVFDTEGRSVEKVQV